MRKIKPTWLRKPKDRTTHDEIVRMVSDTTGFNKNDVDNVINTWSEMVSNEIMERRGVKIRGIGTLFPMVQPPKIVRNMGGGTTSCEYEDMQMPARWRLKFQAEKSLKNKVYDIMVTKRDLEYIYQDNNNNNNN